MVGHSFLGGGRKRGDLLAFKSNILNEWFYFDKRLSIGLVEESKSGDDVTPAGLSIGAFEGRGQLARRPHSPGRMEPGSIVPSDVAQPTRVVEAVLRPGGRMQVDPNFQPELAAPTQDTRSKCTQLGVVNVKS